MWNLRIVFGLLPALAICASGYELYNSDSAVCCNGTVVSVQVSSDSNNDYYYGCCYNEDGNGAKTTYNYNTQSCCDGKVLDWPDHDLHYRCCGGQLYNDRSHICCHNIVHEIKEGEDDCCGDQPYNRNEKLCCSSRDENGIDTLYDKNDSQIACCYGVPYNSTEQACCTGVWKKDGVWGYSQLVDIEDNRKYCCGLQLYDYQTEVCCSEDDTIVPKPAEANPYPPLDCCGGQVVLDDWRQLCMNGRIVEREAGYWEVCGDELYDTRYETCCGDHRLSDSSDKECCWHAGEIYDPETQICCRSEVVQKSEADIASGFDSCCYFDELSRRI